MSTGRTSSQHALPKGFLFFQLYKLLLDIRPIRVLSKQGMLVYKPAKHLSEI